MIANYPSGPVLLDTEILVWSILQPERLSVFVKGVCEAPAYELCVSAASFWEIVVKAGSGKWDLPDPVHWFQKWTQDLRHLPIDCYDVAELYGLPPLHKDPFDRILLAQAVHHKMPLVTADWVMLQYPKVTFVR